MIRDPRLALFIAFAIAFFAIGFPYWQIPYAKIALPDSIVNAGLLAPFLAAAALRTLHRVSFRSAFLVPGIAAPCAILLRVIVDVWRDPTSHNLWPLEVVLASMVGFSSSLCGALAGSGWLLVQRRRDSA